MSRATRTGRYQEEGEEGRFMGIVYIDSIIKKALTPSLLRLNRYWAILWEVQVHFTAASLKEPVEYDYRDRQEENTGCLSCASCLSL
jgi:hypothetical protein